MKKVLKNQLSENDFKQFVDEYSPDEAAEVQRQWKKKKEKERSSTYTKLMIGAIIVMAIVFGLMMSYLTNFDEKKKHFEIQKIKYKDTKYSYLQSNFPHLKFLVPEADTKEVRLLKSLGIIYPEVISWIQGNVRQNWNILYAPNEDSMVNVLGIALAYYLKGSSRGQLTIVMKNMKYTEMTEKNIEMMNKQLGQPLAVRLISYGTQIESEQFDLVVSQNNRYYEDLPLKNKIKRLVYIKSSIGFNTKVDYFSKFEKYSVNKGKLSIESKDFNSKVGYGLIPITDMTSAGNNMLLLASSPQDLEICEQKNEIFKANPELRNLLQMFSNKTLESYNIYYGLKSQQTLKAIANTHNLKQIYSREKFQKIANIIQVADAKQMPKSKKNSFIVDLQTYSTLNLEEQDEAYIYIQNQIQKTLFSQKSAPTNFKIELISPFTNKGCFYPPSVTDGLQQKTLSPPYFLKISYKKAQISPQN